MSNESYTYDLALPESKQLTFTFGGRYPDLTFTLKPDYTIRETKRIQALGDWWVKYFQTPDNKVRDQDHARARKVMTDFLVMASDGDFPVEQFEALPESVRIQVLTKAQGDIVKILNPGADDDEQTNGAASGPNALDSLTWDSSSETLQAPMAAPSALG